MPISLKSLSSGGNAIHQERLILKSGTFVAPIDAVYLVTAIGAGASGALAPSTGSGSCATGGSAGGKAEKKVQLAKGQELAVVIGAGGAKCTVPGTNGNDGGTTTVTGPGIALTANGGKGGKTRPLGAGTALGALGGTAEGGDVNLQGGGSGSATVVATPYSLALTGGGAVAIYEKGYPSGNASSTATGAAYTGGAGVGGPSGNATSTTNQHAITGAGSTVRGSADALNISTTAELEETEPGSTFGFDGRIIDSNSPQIRILAPKGAGTTSNGATASGCGTPILTGSTTLRAGLFAGAGPRNCSPSYRNRSVCGGGTGGAATDYADEAGSGCVVIEWFEEFK